MLSICLIGISVAAVSYADENIEIMSVDGSVAIEDPLEKTTKVVRPNSILTTGNLLTTGPNSRTVVRVGSDGFVVLGKNSKLEINSGDKEKPGLFKQLSGIIYYALNSIKKDKRSIEVRTSTTTIGIRGTRFIVTDNEDRNDIGMRKGVVSVTSTEGDFEIHKKSQLDEFETFKKAAAEGVANNEREFQKYKAQTQQEFIEYKREFSLEANRMASFDGKRVVDLPLGGETRKDMESFESYAEEWLKTVQD